MGEVTAAVREAAGCENAAGIAAWSTVLFDVGFNENDNSVPPRVAASKALDLNEDQANCRFVPAAGELPDNLLGQEIGPAHAAATLRHTATTGVVEWRPFTSPHHLHSKRHDTSTSSRPAKSPSAWPSSSKANPSADAMNNRHRPPRKTP